MSEQPTTRASASTPSLGSRFFQTFRDEGVRWTATGLLGLLGFALAWLWGWFAAGGPLRALGAVPPGAVVAFSIPCPSDRGWSDYGHAAGRFVVGANFDQRHGLKNRLPSDPPAGRETVKLEPKNLPPHIHAGGQRANRKGLGTPLVPIVAILEQREILSSLMERAQTPSPAQQSRLGTLMRLKQMAGEA